MRAVTAGSFARAAGTATAYRNDHEEEVADRNATKQAFMQKSFAIWIGPKSVKLIPAGRPVDIAVCARSLPRRAPRFAGAIGPTCW
jgi:hypothetical protein